MTPERWQQVEATFHLILECIPSERQARLESVCVGDSDLKHEVESLLAAHNQASNFIESAAMEIAVKALAARTFTPGEVVGHFKVLSLLSAGGMGIVYLAEDVVLGRKVALKLLPQQYTRNETRLGRFVQEARATSALNHPNIVTVHEIGGTDAGHFLVMEFIEGRTLRATMDLPSTGKQGPAMLGSVMDWGGQVARALAAAHVVGIVHRDIKPENIMVRDDGYVKVLDFGLACLVPDAPKSAARPSPEQHPEIEPATKTDSNVPMGTVRYMSPEQATGEPVTSATDIFSLGVVLYELATGTHPFHPRATSGDPDSTITVADSPYAGLKSIATKKPQLPSHLNHQVPPALDSLILRMLEREAHLRPSAAQVAEILRRISALWERPKQHRRLVRGLVGIIAFLVGCVILYYLTRAREPAPTTLMAVPFTSDPGYEGYPSFSPDGNQVLYSWYEPAGRNADIYVKPITGGLPTRLTINPASELSPAWSPDGKTIAFLRQHSRNDTRRELFVMPSSSGLDRKVTDLEIPASQVLTPRIAWTPDNKHLIVPTSVGQQDWTALYLIAVTTGEMTRLTHPPAGTFGDSSPALSPNGRWLAFTRYVGEEKSNLFVVPLSREYHVVGGPRRLAPELTWLRDPAWSPDGNYVVFFAFTHGVGFRLYRVAAAGSTPARPLSITGENGGQPAISPMGNRLIYRVSTADYDIWRVEVSSRQAAQMSSEFIASTRPDFMPEYSPDGERIAFLSSRSGAEEIWVVNKNGLNPIQVTFLKAFCGRAVWFPDSRHILFTSDKEGQFDLYSVDAGGGTPKRLTNHAGSDVASAVSRDGRWIYFASTRTARWQIWRMPAAGGEATQLTKGGGLAALEAIDGTFIYYRKAPGNSDIWRIPAEGGTEMRVCGPVDGNNNFTITKTGLYFVAPGIGDERWLRFFDLSSGKMRTVMPLEKTVHAGISVSPDGRFILYSQRERGDSDLMMVENFK